MILKKLSLGLVCVAFGLALSCGGGDDGDEAFDVTSEGDRITSASLENSGDGYKVTLAPIVDPATKTPYAETDADEISVAAAGGGTTPKLKAARMYAALDGESCDVELAFGGGTESAADVAFIVDTTGSMGSIVSGISDSITEFADQLSAAGVDAQYSFVTYGDAFDTMLKDGSPYTKGSGAYEPPSFDADERPLINLTDLDSFKAFVDEVKTNVGSGAGGNGTPENAYAAAVAMLGKSSDFKGLTRRTGVPFYEIIATDACSYTDESQGDGIADEWFPPKKADLETLLGDGSVSIHAVTDTTSCGDQISAKEMADITGGVTLSLGYGDVDLAALNLSDFITNFWIVTIDGSCLKDVSPWVLVLEITVDTRTQTFYFTKV